MKIATLIALVLILSGCTVPAKVEPQDIPEIVSHMFYFKDHSGNCYAGLRSNATLQSPAVVSITAVPCEKVQTRLSN